MWNFTTGSYVDSSPAVVNDIVYISSEDGNIYALNATDGAKLWNYVTSAEVHVYPFPASSPAVITGVVYVGSYGNNVFALNATSGEEIWNYTTGGIAISSPAVARGVLYVGGGNTVYALGVYALNASSTSPHTLSLIIGVLAVVIVAALVALMFRKRLKTKE